MQSTSALRIYPKNQRKEISKIGYYDNIKAFISIFISGKLPLFYTPRTSGLSDVSSILMKKVQEVGQRALIDPDTRLINFESETAITSPTIYILRSDDFLYSLSDTFLPDLSILEPGFYVLEFSDGTNEFESEIFSYAKPKIVFNSNQSTPGEVDFTVTFTGNVFIDWGEGDSKEALTSGVLKSHDYTNSEPRNYQISLSGDLNTVTILSATSNKITNIANLAILVSITELRVNNNLLTGELEISTLTTLAILIVRGNASLTILNVSALVNLTNTDASFCNISIFDISSLSALVAVNVRGNINLTVLDFSALTLLTSINCRACNISVLDVTLCTLLVSLLWESNTMSASEVDAAWNNLAAGTVQDNGVANGGGDNAAPTSASAAARNNLVTPPSPDNWTLTI